MRRTPGGAHDVSGSAACSASAESSHSVKLTHRLLICETRVANARGVELALPSIQRWLVLSVHHLIALILRNLWPFGSPPKAVNSQELTRKTGEKHNRVKLYTERMATADVERNTHVSNMVRVQFTASRA